MGYDLRYIFLSSVYFCTCVVIMLSLGCWELDKFWRLECKTTCYTTALFLACC